MCKVTIGVTIPPEVLKGMDSYVKKVGMGATRSGFVAESIQFYLEHKRKANAAV